MGRKQINTTRRGKEGKEQNNTRTRRRSAHCTALPVNEGLSNRIMHNLKHRG